MSKIKTKTCSRCKKEKPLEEFYKRPERLGRKARRHSNCKICERIKMRNYLNSKKGKTVSKKYAKSINGEISRKKSRQKYAKSKKGKVIMKKAHQKFNKTEKGKNLLRKFHLRKCGLTLLQYNEMLKQQNGCCAICRGINANGRRLDVDHNHETGEIRGLLCGACNRALGGFHEDINRLASAIKYLSGGE